jgi:type IV pilus assembly protein PilB
MANVAGFNRKVASLMESNSLVETPDLVELHKRSSQENKSLAALLVSEEFIGETDLLGLIAEDCGLPPIDLGKITVDMDELTELNHGHELIKEEDAKRFALLPVALLGQHLTLAVSNPYDVLTLDDIKLATSKNILPVVSSDRAIQNTIENAYHGKQKALESFVDQLGDDDDELYVEEKRRDDEGDDEGDLLAEGGEGSPAVKLVNRIILEAIQKKASDIHIEPFEKRVRIRLRIDGVLSEVMNPPKKLEKGLVSRIKIMTDTMNIAEHGKPQDGRFQVKVAGSAIDFRVSSLPLVHGEKICMRLLNKDNLAGSLESLGFEPGVLDILKRSIAAPYGMFLVTGPTGSGKSTTLYSALQAVMTIEDNVNTVEDPVEYEVEGLNQCHVNPKRGLTFANALRALLRQDPDTIMIGEIRDLETIEIAIKAALTGHLVLSTLHTNDAPSTINRIIDMGVEPLMVASSVLAVSAQRLARRLCNACKAKMTPEEMPPRDHLLQIGFREGELEGLELYKAVGCSLCNKGYKGRFAMVECLDMTNDIRQIIINGGSNIDIRNAGINNGMVTLRRAGLMNASRGMTSIDEVLRVSVVDENED